MQNETGGRILKKLYFILAILTAMSASVAVHAEDDIIIEGEKPYKCNFAAYSQTGVSGFHGNGLLTFDVAKYNSGVDYSVEYKAYVPSEGVYEISIIGIGCNYEYTNDYFVTINGSEEEIPVAAGRVEEDIETTIASNLIKRINIGTQYLNKGENSIKIRLDTDDLRSDGTLVFYLDYIKLSKSQFRIDGLKAVNAPMGVFERGNRVKYNLCFTDKTKELLNYDLKITDFWGRTLKESRVTVPKGVSKYELDFGNAECGWYKAELFEAGKGVTAAYANYSVVPKLSERYVGDTPFATDVASSYAIKSDYKTRQLAQTVKLAGIGWVRERMSLDNTKAADRRNRCFSDYGIKVLNNYHSELDIAQTYKKVKKAAEACSESVAMLESWNEMDGARDSYPPADVFASLYKAAALGVADSGTNVNFLQGSLCLSEDMLYDTMMAKNDVMKYSSAYNYHKHTFDSYLRVDNIDTKAISGHRELMMQQNNSTAKPMWMTEVGIYLTYENGEIPYFKRMEQARYLVTSTAQNLSTGVNMNFWFLWRPFKEHNEELGTFDENYNTMPCYQAEAVLTWKLGKGKYKGLIKRDQAEGYVFDNGTSDVLTVWTDNPRKLDFKYIPGMTVTDIMGVEKDFEILDGKAFIDVSHYPIYVTYPEKMPENEYVSQEYTDVKLECKKDFTPAERLIMLIDFPGSNRNNTRGVGDEVTPGEKVDMTVTVYNFNEEDKLVKLSGVLKDYNVNIENSEQTVPAMGKVTVNVTLDPIAKPNLEDDHFLSFTCETDGEKSPPCVAFIRLIDREEITPDLVADGFLNKDNWDKNVAAGTTFTISEKQEGELFFDIVHSGNGDKWFYPRLTVPDASKLDEYSGICFKIKSEPGSEGIGNHNVFCFFKDGRQYYLTQAAGMRPKNEWVQYKLKWSDFTLQASPLGAVDMRPFDPTLIAYISVGGNYKTGPMQYSVKDLGYFKTENTTSGDIAIEGIEKNKEYDAAALSAISAILPDSDFEEINVMTDDNKISTWTREENKIIVDLSSEKSGKHRLRINARDKYGILKSTYVDYYKK